MSRTYVQKGDSITAITPNGGVTSGDPVLIDHLFGVASTTQAAGEEVELVCTGVHDLKKATGVVTAGAQAYFDAVAKKVTTVDTAHVRVGIFVLAAIEAAPTARVRLDGAATPLPAAAP